ncbi:hypothetical protein [Flavobacterium cellulosilyticum]|uniref:Lipoprotein n=1 Tax=Flavobacterium cellulosilyticum TaxID=2541731 RepID=A0A4V2Z071_9FLAO|nr:hypothetical protein [Flavobacterium cellulosilyticum]TDD99857.1 hypothetical protein E0F76_03810 [Flavobacterium cellulosilyticum]
MKNSLFFCVLFILLTSCHQQEKPMIAFYYWKTIFKLAPSEKKILDDNQVKKLYIRYFDINWNAKQKQAFPQSPIRFAENPTNFTIVPVVYIKNKVFLNKDLNILDLAQKTNNFIEQINTKNQIDCQEIQIDCDWTLSSRDNYLKFIDCFKKISKKKLSATIRLHQIKYFQKTKIPNVDKGVLMYYNMGKIASDSLHSIYDRTIAKRYLTSLKKYPLPLSIALPIYSWAVHIRDAKVIGLINKTNSLNFENNPNFKLANKNWIKVTKSNYKSGTYYKKGDLLKLERISKNDLLEMANDLEDNLAKTPIEIIFYDLDEFNIKNYEKDLFEKVTARF